MRLSLKTFVQYVLKITYFYSKNEIDGDAFRLLDRDSLKAMISKQGLLLKFEQKFKQIANNLETVSPKVASTTDSTTPVTVTNDVDSHPVPGTISVSDMPSQNLLKEDVIKEQSKIYGRFKGDATCKLTGWQEAVNAAALKIASKSPNEMYDRASLKTNAEAEAWKTFVYQKKSGFRSSPRILSKGKKNQLMIEPKRSHHSLWNFSRLQRKVQINKRRLLRQMI